MQAKPTQVGGFAVLEFSIQAIVVLRPVVVRIRAADRDLGEQLRCSLSSVALNIAEGSRSQGGNRTTRFFSAAGSNSESRTALRIAVAWGYVQPQDIEAGEAILDRIAAILHTLGARQR